MQVSRQWERMCWSLVAPKMLECPLQCCCTQIATMNGPGVSVCLCVCVQHCFGKASQHTNMIELLLFVGTWCCTILAFPDAECLRQDVLDKWRLHLLPTFINTINADACPVGRLQRGKIQGGQRKGWTGRDFWHLIRLPICWQTDQVSL